MGPWREALKELIIALKICLAKSMTRAFAMTTKATLPITDNTGL
jgi:hypothetical protein